MANLLFVAVWAELIGKSGDDRASFMLYSLSSFLAVVANVLLFAMVFYFSISAVRRIGSKFAVEAARGAFWLVFLLSSVAVGQTMLPMHKVGAPLLGAFGNRDLAILGSCTVVMCVFAKRRKLHVSIGALLSTAFVLIGRIGPIAMVVILAGLGVLMIVAWHRVMTQAASVITLALFPLVPITFFQAGWLMTKFSEKPPAQPVSQSHTSPRIVWIIFDELDHKMTFESRPAGLELPELDRFRDASIVATNAYPPTDFTIMAMPALICGRLVTAAEPVHPSELLVTFADSGERLSWGAQLNIFSRARELGVNGAIVGWYHPYCRIIGDQVVSCMSRGAGQNSLPDMIARQIQTVTSRNALIPDIGVLTSSERDRLFRREEHINTYIAMIEASRLAVTDPRIGLVLLHLPVPHPPGIFSRASGEFDASGNSSYVDNLKLVDKTVGELRMTMERAGLWEDSNVLISSDHWWRSGMWRFLRESVEGTWTPEDEAVFADEVDKRVPFILKLAGQSQAVLYTPEFNTVLTHDLFLALLRGDLRNADDVIGWLDRNRSIGESPYKYKRPR